MLGICCGDKKCVYSSLYSLPQAWRVGGFISNEPMIWTVAGGTTDIEDTCHEKKQVKPACRTISQSDALLKCSMLFKTKRTEKGCLQSVLNSVSPYQPSQGFKVIGHQAHTEHVGFFVRCRSKLGFGAKYQIEKFLHASSLSDIRIPPVAASDMIETPYEVRSYQHNSVIPVCSQRFGKHSEKRPNTYLLLYLCSPSKE